MPSKIFSYALSSLLITSILLVVTVRPAYAYIDLGSGSYIIQILLASIFASLFALKMFWRRVTLQVSQFFSRNKTSEVDEGDDNIQAS